MIDENKTIAWNDTTWNPVRGCTKVSPGCDRCYAERIATRGRGVPGHAYEQGFEPRAIPANVAQPLGWKRPRRILVCSMGDLFHEQIDAEHIACVFDTMNVANWHVYQVLTRRAERMREIVTAMPRERVVQPQIWLGVSVEDRAHGVPRIDVLRDVPASVRFLRIEPLLEDLGELNLAGIHWVSVTGETGPRARPMEPAWVHAIQRQCDAQGVPFFFKGWGGRVREIGAARDGKPFRPLPVVTAP